jgi:alkaline phosphatase
MKKTWIASSGLIALAVSQAMSAAVLPTHQTTNPWYTDGQSALLEKLTTNNQFKAKNVILFVGDGMGISTLTASRILQGQLAGNSGEEAYLSFEKPSHTALVRTYNVDA